MARVNKQAEQDARVQDTFPNTDGNLGRTRHGSKILESGFTQPSYQGTGRHVNPENFTDGAPMKDTPHPHTGEDVFGPY